MVSTGEARGGQGEQEEEKEKEGKWFVENHWSREKKSGGKGIFLVMVKIFLNTYLLTITKLLVCRFI